MKGNTKEVDAVMAQVMKEDADKRLADVAKESAFWCNDGRTVKNMRDLQEALEQMSDEVYAFHANAEKNDFSIWARDVLMDERLYLDLSRSADRSEAAKRVAARVTVLSSRR